MATHIICFYPYDIEDIPVDGVEELVALLSSCSDNELVEALTEAEGTIPDDNELAWHQAMQDYKPRMIREAQELLELAKDELHIAEMRYQKLVKQLEELQVLEDMAKHARSTYDSTIEQIARVEEYFDGTDPELNEAALALHKKLIAKLNQFNAEYVSELEAQVMDAKEQLNGCISLEDAHKAVLQAEQAVAEAEERLAKLQ